MSKEIWTRWKPLENLASAYYIDILVDDLKCFKLILSEVKDESKKVTILFENYVLAYRNTDESFRQNLMAWLDKEYGGEFWCKWNFFKVSNSNYVSWLAEQSYDFSESEGIVHFSIIDIDCMVDIIANYEPKFMFSN